MINRQQLQLINRKRLQYPLGIAEKDYHLKVFDLVRQKEVRAPISPQAIHANWQIASLAQEDDLRAIFCTRQVDNMEIQSMLRLLDFTPILPEA
jgi:hypothetical protein